jgi:hypothetical protein
MQLIIKREEDILSIEIKDGVSTIKFDYIEMLKKILQDQKIEETVFMGDITDDEKDRISEMVEKIEKAIPEKNGEVEEDVDG